MKISEKFNLEGKVAIITGSSKGIGKAIALAFAQQGAKVVISSRKQEAIDETAAEFKKEGLDVEAIACHMGDSAQISHLVEETIKRCGRIDIVVNNAATNPIFGPIEKADSDAFNQIMAINVKGPLELAQLCFPNLEKSKGSVINISSIEGITPGQGLGLYSVSKSALIQLTRVLAKEWGSKGIRANTICPGLVKTKFSEALTSNEHILKHVVARQALPQVAEPIDIAGLALFLASDASSFCTGQEFTADGGYTI